MLESFKSQEAELSAELFQTRESIQSALVFEVVSNLGESEDDRKDRNMQALGWLDKYAASFQQIFNEYLVENPNVVDDWADENDLSKREKILDDFRLHLYGPSKRMAA